MRLRPRSRATLELHIAATVERQTVTAPSVEQTEAQQQTIGSHSPIAVVLHWGFIGVFAYALTKQIDELDELEDFSLLQNEMIFAAVFLALLFARFLYMRLTRPTVLPSDTPRMEMLMAQSVHLGMYASLAMIAVTGLVIGGMYWSGIKDGTGMHVALVAHEFFVQSKLSSHLFARFGGSLSPPKRRWYLECYGTLLLEGGFR